MSIIKTILEEMWNYEIRYKGGWGVNLFGVPRFNSYNKNSLKASFYRLSKNGYIEQTIDGWRLTLDGKRYMKREYSDFKSFTSPSRLNAPKNLIVIFDIPYEKRAERDWLRNCLKKFGFIMIQRSVWVGPSPLPKEFLDYIKKINLKKCLKTFKLAKAYQAR